MQNLKRERESKGKFPQILKVVLTSLMAAFACAGIIYAATTVGTNISTTGTLTATGLTTLGNASSTLSSISSTELSRT